MTLPGPSRTIVVEPAHEPERRAEPPEPSPREPAVPPEPVPAAPPPRAPA